MELAKEVGAALDKQLEQRFEAHKKEMMAFFGEQLKAIRSDIRCRCASSPWYTLLRAPLTCA